MATDGDNLPPKAPDGSARPHASDDLDAGFMKRHGTGITVVIFLVVGAALGVSPIPDRFRPVDISTPDARQAVLDRVFRKPKMTFTTISAELEAAEEADEVDDDGAEPDEEGPDEELLVAILGEQGPEAPRVKRRRGQSETRKVKALRSIAERLEANGSPIENPCLEPIATGCKKTALDPLFTALDALDAGEPGRRVDVVTLGNSLIASDHVTDIVRARLVDRFGDGGRGYLLPDRLSKVAGRRVRTGRGTDGWEINTFAMKPPPRGHYGYTGSHHESTRKGDRIKWKLKGADHARLYWLDHDKSASFTLEADGKVLQTVSPSGEGAQDRFLDVDLPAGAETLELVADGKEVVIYGVTLERSAGGLSWDTIGVPASDSFMYLTADEGVFKRQLAARDPTLMVLMVGGNEIRSMSFKWKTLDEVKDAYAAFIDRVKEAAPNAACLAVAPIDAAKATAAGANLTTRKEVAPVVEAQKAIALEKGCAYFNLFEAMGGEGSLQRFHRAGLVNDDLVHPKGAGGDVLGQLFADALFESYVSTPRPVTEGQGPLLPPDLFGLTFDGPKVAPTASEHPLTRVLDKLAALDDAGAKSAVRVGLFGDRHLADQALSDQLRERLVARYGAAGRGYVSAGDADPALLKSRVVRKLSGPHAIIDARSIERDALVGLDGTAVTLEPTATLELTFCEGCSPAAAPREGTLRVSWVPLAADVVAEVMVNDVSAGSLTATADAVGKLQTFSAKVRDDKHAVRISVSAGKLTVLGLSHDAAGPGVVVDAHAKARTTGMTLGRFARTPLEEQVRARGYDLVITAWGSEEAWLKDLDEKTYRHHLESSLGALLEASEGADCIVMGPIDQSEAEAPTVDGGVALRPLAPQQRLVERVQREVAASRGCAYFNTYRAMGGRRAIAVWQERGFANADLRSLTVEGERKLADVLLGDVFRWAEFIAKKRAVSKAAPPGDDVAKRDDAPAPNADGKASAPADGGVEDAAAPRMKEEG